MSKKKPIFDILKSFFDETISFQFFNDLLPTKVYIYNDSSSMKVRVSTKKNKNLELIGECFLDNVKEKVKEYSESLGYKNRPVSVHSLTNKTFKGPKTEKQLEASRRSYKGCIKNPKVGYTFGQMAKEHPEFYSQLMKRVAIILKENGHYNRIGLMGATALNEKRIKEGTLGSDMEKMRSFITPEGRERMREAFIKAAREVAKTPEHRERCRKMGEKYGAINGRKGMDKIKKDPRCKEWCSKGGLAGGAKKAIERGTHNFLSQSPNNKLVICPDGHISSAPSAPIYCKDKKLDCSLIREMEEGYIESIDLLIVNYLKENGISKLSEIHNSISYLPLKTIQNRVFSMVKDNTIKTTESKRKYFL